MTQKTKPPVFHFCPRCGNKLESRREEGADRAFCPKDGWTYYPHPPIAVVGIILRHDRGGTEVLLVKRGREPKKGLWSLPAGFVEYGEHPDVAIQREIFEETGRSVRQAMPYVIKLGYDDPRAPLVMVHFYRLDVDDGPMVNDHEENETIEWHYIDKLPPMAWATNIDVLETLRRQLR